MSDILDTLRADVAGLQLLTDEIDRESYRRVEPLE